MWIKKAPPTKRNPSLLRLVRFVFRNWYWMDVYYWKTGILKYSCLPSSAFFYDNSSGCRGNTDRLSFRRHRVEVEAATKVWLRFVPRLRFFQSDLLQINKNLETIACTNVLKSYSQVAPKSPLWMPFLRGGRANGYGKLRASDFLTLVAVVSHDFTMWIINNKQLGVVFTPPPGSMSLLDSSWFYGSRLVKEREGDVPGQSLIIILF